MRTSSDEYFWLQFSVAGSCMAVWVLRGSLSRKYLSMAISWRQISQGRVATRLRFGAIFNYCFTTNLSLSLTGKEFFFKSAKIWQSYSHEFGGLLFWKTVYVRSTVMQPKNFPLSADFQRTWTSTVCVSWRHALSGTVNKMFNLFII